MTLHRFDSLRLLLASACAAALALATGCVGYSSYPEVKEDTAFNNTNSSAMTDLMIVAIQWVTTKHPVDGPFAISLPQGMLRKRIDSIFQRLHDPNARPMTPETASLPTFFVTRIDVRASNAEVDIIRPVTHMRGPGDKVVYQTITVYCHGGLHPWKAEYERAYMMGMATPPEPSFIPDADTAPLAPSTAGPHEPQKIQTPSKPQ